MVKQKKLNEFFIINPNEKSRKIELKDSNTYLIKLISSLGEKESLIYNYEDRIIKKLNSLNDKQAIFCSFLYKKRLKGTKVATLLKYINVYEKFLQDVDLKKIDIDIFDNIFWRIKNYQGHTDSTKNKNLKLVKSISKFCNSNLKAELDEYNIKVSKTILKPHELFTETEKEIIINNQDTLEKVVFFSVLFGSTFRSEEMISITNESFTKIDGGYLVSIGVSKTKVRTNFIFKNIESIDTLLNTGWKNWSFTYGGISKVIRKYKEIFGKRTYLHLARKTTITNLGSELEEQELKKYAGLSPNSKVLEHYVAISEGKIIAKLQNKV